MERQHCFNYGSSRMIDVLILFVLYIGIGLPISLFLSGKRINWQKTLGESFFLGIFVVIVVLNLMQLFSLSMAISILIKAFIFVSALSLALIIYYKRSLFELPSFGSLKEQQNILYFMGLLLVIYHVYHMIVQNNALPLIAWDSWNGWVAKAKIWYYHGFNEPLVDRLVWLKSESEFTNPIAHYPDGLSLLYLINSGIWGWSETQLNAIFPAMFIAFLLMFYGNVKLLTESKNCAWLAVILLIAIPIVNIHIILAGYADIWVAAYLAMSVFNTQYFLSQPSKKLFVIITIFAIAMLMFKLESWIWMAIFVSAYLLSVMSKTKRLWLSILFISVCIIWYFNDGISISLPMGELIFKPNLIQIPALGSFSLTYLNTTDALIEALFLSNSWNILWYSLPVLIILPFKIKDKSLLLLPSIFLIFTLMFLFVLFYMTYASDFANDFTSSNRIVMHVVPVYIYLLIQVFRQFNFQKNTIA